MHYSHDIAGFIQFAGDFDPAFVLECANMKDSSQETGKLASKETEEYGGFLLMLDTVPERSDYDYGSPYLRIGSTFIPRIIWTEKPVFGREQWIKASGMVGSELKRLDIVHGAWRSSVLGRRPQLNGGALGDRDRPLSILKRCMIRICLRILPPPPGQHLGASLLGPQLLQRLVHGGLRRPDDLVLLQLGVHHDASARLPVARQPVKVHARAVCVPA